MSEAVAAAPAPPLTEFVRYARPRPWHYLVYSAGLELLYWLWLLPALLAAAYAFYVEQGVLGPVTVWFALGYALVETVGRLRRRLRVNAPAALARAKRQPILYLRSFYYENADGRPESAAFADLDSIGRKTPRREKENDDEVLALALRGVGPLIAVGKPGSRLPPLGAIRLFFGNDEWQEQVRRLIALSRFVIVQPGYSDGTEWEIGVLKGLAPEKVIYSFLSWQHLGRASRQIEYEIFAMQMKRIYGCELPAKLRNAYFLVFDEDGRPQLVRLPVWQRPFFWLCSRLSLVWWVLTTPFTMSRFRGIYKLFDYMPTPRIFRRFSVPGVREALRPVLRRRGVRVPVWRSAVFAAALLLGFCALWGARAYAGVSGSYRLVAYGEGDAVLFTGDVRLEERTPLLPGLVSFGVIEGRYELRPPDGTASPCPAGQRPDPARDSGGLSGFPGRGLYDQQPRWLISLDNGLEAEVWKDGAAFAGVWRRRWGGAGACGYDGRNYTGRIRLEKKTDWRNFV